MVVSVKIKQKNPGWLDAFKSRLLKQCKQEVAVGYPKGEQELGAPWYDSGASILQVAVYNNFGTENIPARPFMANAAPKLQEMWLKLQKDAQPAINAGKLTEEEVMKTAALQGETIVRQAIDALKAPPNSPETIARKKSSKPLIDSGDMRKYVKGVVRPKS